MWMVEWRELKECVMALLTGCVIVVEVCVLCCGMWYGVSFTVVGGQSRYDLVRLAN